MRTTYTLDDKEAEALISATHSKNLPQALNKLVEEWQRKQKIEFLFSCAGKFHFDYSLEEMDKAEQRRFERLHGPRTR